MNGRDTMTRMKQRKPLKRKRTTRRRQRELIVTVKESGEPVDLDAFCESYARLLIREVQEKKP